MSNTQNIEKMEKLKVGMQMITRNCMDEGNDIYTIVRITNKYVFCHHLYISDTGEEIEGTRERQMSRALVEEKENWK